MSKRVAGIKYYNSYWVVDLSDSLLPFERGFMPYTYKSYGLKDEHGIPEIIAKDVIEKWNQQFEYAYKFFLTKSEAMIEYNCITEMGDQPTMFEEE